MKKALVVWGGWDGHEPQQVADILAGALRGNDFEVEVADTLDAFLDEDKLKELDLIVPEWTMGEITPEQLNPVLAAVSGGVGLAGLHGGMCDAFRQSTQWQFMTGGQWVAHPGGAGVTYTVNIVKPEDPIVAGIEDFEVTSEQYYMHVDPGNEVLATTTFVEQGNVVMPVVWKRMWGEGRVFYSSLGHDARVAAQEEPLTIMTRGMLWAAKAD
ncbi:MAG: ThuA domain-containing protein [Armatimonadetes bacterium]|nr:ThuA domain-containing protein [Armatimonadota bacterium]